MSDFTTNLQALLELHKIRQITFKKRFILTFIRNNKNIPNKNITCHYQFLKLKVIGFGLQKLISELGCPEINF